MEANEQLAAALEKLNIEIIRYVPDKVKALVTKSGSMTVKKLMETVASNKTTLKKDSQDVCLANEQELNKMIYDYAEEKGLLNANLVGIPEELQGLQLNCDLSAKNKDDEFFLTYDDETVSRVSGKAYIGILGLKQVDAYNMARKVIPEYLPRARPGVAIRKTKGKEGSVFNKYIPPDWKRYPNRKELPDKLPVLFEKLVRHLFPLVEEREFFYSWLYSSMFDRAMTYLVLCGPPGTGKNRLKLVMRALHGHANATDGKKSTLVERFNSQLSDTTMCWFDELHYDMDMENVMKELQNDTIAIERKGVDATRATRIHASLIISNNKPRDNYIAFDARKFVPLQITPKRLEESMTPAEIDELTKKVENEDSSTFDIKFLAQIAMWIKRRGLNEKWPNLEYRGPMFWKLAHTSMSRWQKKAATVVLETNPKSSGRIIYDEKKGFLWSSIHEISQRKNGDRSLQFPDFSTVKYFFDIFKDSNGKKAFKTLEVHDNIMNDFYVRPLIARVEIITEAKVMDGHVRKESSKKEKGDEEILDL